jgi:hypothetical protein
MKIDSLLIVLVVGIASLNVTFAFADERIWLKDTKVNGESVKLCFDSGANINALSPQALRRLALKFDQASTNDPLRGALVGDTVVCTLSIDGIQGQAAFVPLNIPSYANADVDGLVGWWPLRQNIMKIDATLGEVTFLPKVPLQVVSWNRFSVITNFGTLEFEVPHANDINGVISIDTGSDWGMALPYREWRRWKETHPHSPVTLKTLYTQEDGFVVLEEAWADQIFIGPLVLTNVPIIEETPSAEVRWGDKDDGTLGLAALSRVNVVVDGKNSVIYLQPKTTQATVYSHNHLGAVFVPTTGHLSEAVALVELGSPAYEAGVRNGDILLQVDEIPVTGWSKNWLSRFNMPPGTKLHLTLQRVGKAFKTTVTLRQIIPPENDR